MLFPSRRRPLLSSFSEKAEAPLAVPPRLAPRLAPSTSGAAHLVQLRQHLVGQLHLAAGAVQLKLSHAPASQGGARGLWHGDDYISASRAAWRGLPGRPPAGLLLQDRGRAQPALGWPHQGAWPSAARTLPLAAQNSQQRQICRSKQQAVSLTAAWPRCCG